MASKSFLPLQEQGTGGGDPSWSGMEMSHGPSFPAALDISASPRSLRALEQPPLLSASRSPRPVPPRPLTAAGK